MQKRLDKIKEYFRSMERMDDKWVLCVEYKDKWGAYPSDNGKVQVAPDEKVPNVYWYFPKDKTTGIEDIVTLIEETIQTNIDAGKKAELFTLKAKELRNLFSDEKMTYNQLKTLKFVFGEEVEEPQQKAKKPTRKSKPKTKKDIMSQAVDDAENSQVTIEQTNCDVDVATITDTIDYSTTTVSVTNATDMSQDEIDDLRG